MNISFQPSPSPDNANIQLARWGSTALAVLVLLVYGYFLLNTFQQPSTPVLYLATAILAISFIMTVLGLIFIQRNRQETGLKLTLYSLYLIGVFVSIFYYGRVLTASFSIFTVSIFAIEWLLPETLRRRYIVLTLITVSLMWVVEWIDPTWRVNLGTATVGPFATGLFVIFLAVTTYRRFRGSLFSSLRSKLLVAFVGMLAILAALFIFFNYYATIRNIESQGANDLLRIKNAVQGQFGELQKLALALATDMANDPEVQATFAARDREQLKKITLPTFNILQRDFDVKQYHFIMPPATSFLRLHQVDQFGDDLTSFRATVIQANSEKEPVSGLEIGRGGLGVRGVVPVFYQDRHIGVIDVGIDISSDFLFNIKEQYGVDVQIVLDQKVAQTATFQGSVSELQGPTSELVFQASTNELPFFVDEAIYTQVMNGESVVSNKNISGQEYAIISFPLIDYSGKTIGVIEIISNRTTAIAEANKNLLNTILIALFILLISGIAIVQIINTTIKPITELTLSANTIAEGNLNIVASIQSSDEVGVLAKAFNLMTSQLREMVVGLEQRVADRTRNLELAAEVGRAVSQVRALDVMLTDAAELIREQFNLYYVQVYLVNPSQTYLILQSGTGDVGRELLNRNHRLPLTANSLNGRAATEKKPVIIADTLKSATFKPNSLLPMTRSEMSIPLMIGDKVVGVLDMQSDKKDTLNKDVLPAFEALAGQLAIAIQNANFLAETQQARAEVEAQAQRMARSNWANYLDAIHKSEHTGFVYENDKVEPLTTLDELKNTDISAFMTPIEVAGEPIGSLVVEQDESQLTERDSQLIEAVARQVAQQVENLRLLDSAERYRSESEQAARRLTYEGWQEYMQSQANDGISYMYDLKNVKPYRSNGNEQPETDGYTLPLKARDEIIGKLVVQGLDTTNTESVELVNAVAERLGIHLEGLRLSNQTEQALLTTQKQAEREQALRQITSAVRGSTDPVTILRSAARELGTFLGRKTVIRLTTDSHSEETTLHDGKNPLLSAKSPSQEA